MQLNSSSPFGQSFVPSHRLACEIQIAGIEEPHLRACSGHTFRSLQSSSEPSAQSFLPSQTKNQLIHTPVLLHCKNYRMVFQKIYLKPKSTDFINHIRHENNIF